MRTILKNEPQLLQEMEGRTILIVDDEPIIRDLCARALKGYRILLTDSRVPRFGVDSELKGRRSDIKKGLDILSHKRQGASFRDYAEQMADDVGLMIGWPEEAVSYFDWSSWVDDQRHDYVVEDAPAPEYGVYVFRSM